MAAPQEPHAPSPKRYRTMTRYALSRLGQLVLVLIGVSMVVFFTMHVLPGDVATLLRSGSSWTVD